MRMQLPLLLKHPHVSVIGVYDSGWSHGLAELTCIGVSIL